MWRFDFRVVLGVRWHRVRESVFFRQLDIPRKESGTINVLDTPYPVGLEQLEDTKNTKSTNFN